MSRETQRKFSTTPGTRDVLPPESTRLLDVQSRVLERFRMHGFREVVTPALEYAEVVDEPMLRDTSFKLFDPDNQTLVLRPEMTTPIARLVVQRLRNSPPPHKLSYSLPVYRRANVGRGQSAEFHQAGVEVVGSSSPGEDAGAISLLVDALESLGLRAAADFVLVLGQTAFYEGYLRRHAPGAAPDLLSALAAKDLVRVDEVSATLPDEVAAGARGIPRIVGPATDASVLERAGRYAEPGSDAEGALANLREILSHLDAYGRLGAVMLDFGLIGRRNYYTGAVYEVYAAGLGFTVANGGRYDNLLLRFGEPLPATGFAISLERLISVLPDEKPPPLLVLVGGSVEAARATARLRALDVPVLYLTEDLPQEAALRYARSVDAAWVCYPAPDGLKLAAANPESGFELATPESVAVRVLS
ncbi:MAG TPA: ATP phosphoribosyltransferase regulatory subunit [Rubrobacteraceae bacterium]|nr:ATP phosphoribosyltransferase regulatory subunit [Rubrobacteraceae bacterium]